MNEPNPREILDQSELLMTLSEIEVAFAGFTGVMVVLGRRSSETWSIQEHNTIRTLLHTSVGSTILALLPVVLEGYLSSPALLWRLLLRGLLLVVIGED